jgi:hypothetical protein
LRLVIICGCEQDLGVESQALNGLYDARPFVVQKTFALVFKKKLARTGADEHAEAAALFDELLVDEALVAFEDGERVDAEVGGDLADGGQRVAFAKVSVEHHRHDAVAELAVDGLSVVPVEFHAGLLCIGVIYNYNTNGKTRGIFGAPLRARNAAGRRW